MLSFTNIILITQRGERNELMEPGPGGHVLENPSNGDILHLESEEADRLAGALMNDFSRELVMVNKQNIYYNLEPKTPGSKIFKSKNNII